MNNTTGILVKVSFGKFAPKVKNTKATKEYANNHQCDESMHESRTHLIPKQYVDPIQKFQSSVRNNFINNITLPWERGGTCLIPAKVIDKFMSGIGQLRQEYDQLVAEFLEKYEDIVADAKKRLNGDFDASRYPSRADVSACFRMDISYSPLPDAGDYRIDVSKEIMDEVRAETNRASEARYEAARQDLRQRLIDKVSHLADRCKAINESDKAKWFESNLTNITDLIDIIPDMLIGEDNDLLEAVKSAKAMLNGIDSDLIKGNESVRDEIRKKAAAIVSSLQF
jgi:F0F1-type ATP synthase membrane subunit b/b'